jgi:hypothetical protein
MKISSTKGGDETEEKAARTTRAPFAEVMEEEKWLDLRRSKKLSATRIGANR